MGVVSFLSLGKKDISRQRPCKTLNWQIYDDVPTRVVFRASPFRSVYKKSLSIFCPKMYVDDTSISTNSEDPLLLLEDLIKELEGIVDWLRQNKLSLNVAKSECFFVIANS